MISIADMKVGDRIPAGTMVKECWMTVYGPDGEVTRLRIPSLPIEAYASESESDK